MPGVLTKAEAREKIQALQSWMEREMPAELVRECVTRHTFAPGIYCREIDIPAGVLVVGKIHRHPTVNILAKGSVIVFAEGMAEPQLLHAPFTFVSGPGVQKVGFAMTDATWINIHATEETDLAKIEEEFIAPSIDALDIEVLGVLAPGKEEA